MTFENGLTISVQFGSFNYCDNRSNDVESRNKRIYECSDAEIAIWDADNKWFNFGSDEVKGWCSADEVAQWITETRAAHSIETIKKPLMVV